MATYTNLILRTLNSPFVGNTPDVTRNSVLSHKDVDNNFIFLKGEDIITGSTSGTSIILTQVNTDIIEIDILPILNCPDNYTTGSTLVGHTVVFDTKNSLSAYTVDLSPISGDTNTDNFTTGTTLVGKTIHYDRTDAVSAFTTDLTSLFPATDYGNIIFVSEVGPTGLTRSDVIGDINIPVDINWASQIAQSGDTIHVKSGIYNCTTSSSNGLTVSGVNHYFEPKSEVYKTTGDVMFGKLNGTTEGNVYGSGSFYGSGACGAIFANYGTEGSGHIQTYEWDVCENTVTSCYVSLNSNENIALRGKKKIVSTGSFTIFHNGSAAGQNLFIDCPEITSTISFALFFSTTDSNGTGNLRVNAETIENTSGGVALTWGGQQPNSNVTVNANYVNYINSTPLASNYNKATLNIGRIDDLGFIGSPTNGSYLKVNGHVGFFSSTISGIVDIDLIDRCHAGGSGTINATFNGDFDYTSDSYGTDLVMAIAGNITCNFKLQNNMIDSIPGQTTYDYVNGWFCSFSGAGRLNMLGNWDIQDFWITMASGVLNISSATVINIGPNRNNTKVRNNYPGYIAQENGEIGETFNIAETTVNIQGTIIERCNDGTAPCDLSQSAHTNSNALIFVKQGINPTGNNPWDFTQIGDIPERGTRIIYNGATIVVRDQDSQLITTNATGGTIGIYSAGLNTNKMDAFEAEQEKIRVSVTGTSATFTANTETFTSTTGATAAASAAELVSLINASGTVNATASQDTVGVDGYFYIESDVAGVRLELYFGNSTAFDTFIRYNTLAVTDIVGGTLIEDPEIMRNLFS